MFSFPESIKITSEVNKTIVQMEKLVNINITGNKVVRFKKSKPILYKLHEKSLKNMNSFNYVKNVERIKEIDDPNNKNDYEYNNQLNQINKRLKFSSCKNFNFSPQNIFIHKSLEKNNSNNISKDKFNVNICKTEE